MAPFCSDFLLQLSRFFIVLAHFCLVIFDDDGDFDVTVGDEMI